MSVLPCPLSNNRSYLHPLVLYRLAPCHGGLGKGSECQSKYEGDFESSMGRLAYEPSSSHEDSEIVDQLSTLLTSGRMSGSKRTLIQDAYREAHGNFGDKNHALRVAQQLIISTPEFHSNSLSSNSDTDRASADDLARKSCKKYKAVVHLRLLGGLDSYNLIVPYSGCSGKSKFDIHRIPHVRDAIFVCKTYIMHLTFS